MPVINFRTQEIRRSLRSGMTHNSQDPTMVDSLLYLFSYIFMQSNLDSPKEKNFSHKRKDKKE